MKETIVGTVHFDIDQGRRLRSAVEIMSRVFRGWWRGIVLLWKTLGHQTGGPIFVGGEIEGRGSYASLQSPRAQLERAPCRCTWPRRSPRKVSLLPFTPIAK